MNDIDDHVESPQQTEEKTEPDYRQTRTYENPEAPRAAEYTADDLRGMLSLPSNEESMFMQILKAILGAVVGAIPGILLWIIIGKAGFIAVICGFVLSGGVVCGYIFMTKDNSIPEKYGIIICAAVIIIGVYIAEKIVWCWVMTDAFQKSLNDLQKEVYSLGEELEMDKSDMDSIIEESIKEEYGFTKGTLSDFFFNFNKTISYLGLSAKYYGNLLECYLFAALGAFSIFKKSGNRF